MTTFANLQTRVSRALRDPTNKTFSLQEVADFLNEGLAEISRLAPKRFLEVVTVVADTLSYTLTTGASPEMEIKRVEVWDKSVTPKKQVYRIQPASAEYEHNSQTGWEYWDGKLYIPNEWENLLEVATHEIRVWGYGPYTTVDIASAAATDQGLSNELEKALLAYCKVEALTRLVMERDLFTQWQTRSGNSDVSPASLMSGLSIAQDDWRRRSRAVAVLREAP